MRGRSCCVATTWPRTGDVCWAVTEEKQAAATGAAAGEKLLMGLLEVVIAVHRGGGPPTPLPTRVHKVLPPITS